MVILSADGVAVLDAGPIAQRVAVFRDLPRKRDGAVLAAGAAHRDGELALALLDVERKSVFQKRLIAFQQLLRLRMAHDEIDDFLIESRLMLQLRNVERVGQAADVQHEGGLRRDTELEAEGHDRQAHGVLGPAVRVEQVADPLLVLGGGEQAGIDGIIGPLLEGLQNSTLLPEGLPGGEALGDADGVAAARLAVAAHQHLVRRLQKKDIPKAEPVLATTENKLIEEKEKAVVVNDALTTERLAYWKQRRYLSLPIDSMVITSHYGKRKDPFTGKIANHRGIDLKGNNDYVYSIMPGMVVKTGKNKGLGNYVEVRHGDFTSIYGHLYSVLVNAKQAVEAGQPIGISGSTGRSTGEHLHFQMEYKDKTIDPKPILDYINEVIRTVKGQISQQIDNELRRK